MTRPAMSTREASRKTADAADQLLDWLGQQGGLPDGNGDGQADLGHSANGSPKTPSPVSPLPPIPAKCEAFAREDAVRGLGETPEEERDVDQGLTRRAGRAPRKSLCSPKRFAFAAGFADDAARAAVPPRPQHTDWLHHRLLVAGPAGTLADFQAAACGAGAIPWRLDLDSIEEDLFLMLAAPPPPQRRHLSLVGARALAGQLREAAEQRHVAAVARVGRSRACALDLHALVPVPDGVLRLGPNHPRAFAPKLLWC